MEAFKTDVNAHYEVRFMLLLFKFGCTAKPDG